MKAGAAAVPAVGGHHDRAESAWGEGSACSGRRRGERCGNVQADHFVRPWSSVCLTLTEMVGVSAALGATNRAGWRHGWRRRPGSIDGQAAVQAGK